MKIIITRFNCLFFCGFPYALFLVFFLQSSISYSQISADDTAGCAPLVGVNFKGVPSSLNILWDFADGSSSNILNPKHTFSNPGAYNVKYTANISGNPVTYFLIITVFGKPIPKFINTTDSSGCAPFAVSFQSLSTGSGGVPITNHSWAFGDGGINISNTTTPTYTYTDSGQYSVTLIVKDANGCDSSLSVPKSALIAAAPEAVISSSPDPPTSCTAPFSVFFNASASISHSFTSSTLSYSWDLGDGVTSTSAEPPVQNYPTLAIDTIYLIVKDDNGCSDTSKSIVNVQDPFASFFTGDTVCKSVFFNDLASTSGYHIWNYGDGIIDVKPYHTYADSGTYTVKLFVTSGSCLHDTTQTIYVQDVKADFSIVPSYACELPQVVSFINNSSDNILQYSWWFPDTAYRYDFSIDSSKIKNPNVTITDLNTNEYLVNNSDEMLTTTLIVTSKFGCTDTIKKYLPDTVFIVTALLQPDVTEGCAPLTVLFYDSSRSREPIVARTWDFGDGTILNGNSPISHTYTAPGIYEATITVNNSKGCADTSYKIIIKVGSAPIPDFTIMPDNLCVNQKIQIQDQSVPTGNSPIDVWHYYTEDGLSISSCYRESNPEIPFPGATGNQTITLVTCSRGCCDSITKNNIINIQGPLVEFTASMDCDSPDVFNFIAQTSEAEFWTWDFGDGTIISNSIEKIISHTYSSTGSYLVRLIGFNNSTGCNPDTFELIIYVKQILASFSSKTSVCNKIPEAFDGSASVDPDIFGNNGYTWLWGDERSPTITSNPIANHVYTESGSYTVKLIVTDKNGCKDTAEKIIKVSSVEADFIPDKYFGCIPWTVNFNETSTSDTTITNWNWSYGDGSFGNFIVTTDPSHKYNNSVSLKFNVQLIVINKMGCRDTAVKTLTPSKPDAEFKAITSRQGCIGDSSEFLPDNLNNINYLWDFGDGSDSLTGNHVYTTAGKFDISLTVTDSIGCIKKETKANYITIQAIPEVKFISNMDTMKEKCIPVLASFTDSSIASLFQSRKWNLGNGGTVNPIVNPSTVYQQPGTYNVSLIVTTTFGCLDTLEKTYKVFGPVADFSSGKTAVCRGDSISFTLKDTSDVAFFHWDFGDGYDTAGVSPVSHKFDFRPANGQSIVRLIYWSEDSTCAKTKSQIISIYQVNAGFKRNNEAGVADTAHCYGPTDNFINISENGDQWKWNFGDGTTSGIYSPQHKFDPGTYVIKLNIENSIIGCVDSISKIMKVFPLPIINATGGDTCFGDPFTLRASGGEKYQWTPGTGLNSDTAANPIANLEATTSFKVTTTDSNLCTAETTVTVVIFQPPAHVEWDTTVFIGERVPIKYILENPSDYIFSWSPSDSLSCTDCLELVARPNTDTKYILTVKDLLGCFNEESYYFIKIQPDILLDVPTAFTPNGDGFNDKIFVEGTGIKKLIEFKIYNRWGELVFRTEDLKEGWDGIYKGAIQNIDTYSYYVKADVYNSDKPKEKQGLIKLLK